MNRIGPGVGIISMIVCLFLFIPPDAGARRIKLRYTTFLPAKHVQFTLASDWAKEVEKKTGGKVQIDVFPAGALIDPAECYSAVVHGMVDLGFCVSAYTPDRFPVMRAADLPMGYPDGKMASFVAHQFAKFFQPSELDDVELLYAVAPGPKYLHATKAVKNLEDIKGMKIRATGSLKEVAAALGAAPAFVPYSEINVALQRGVIDAVFASNSILKSLNLVEVTRHTTDTTVVSDTSAMFVVMNKKRWETLPPDVQKVIEALSEPWVNKHGEAWDRMDSEGWEYAAERGRKMVTLTGEESVRWREAAVPTIRKYVDTAQLHPAARCAALYVSKIEALLIEACSHCACPPGTYPCDKRCCKRLRQ